MINYFFLNNFFLNFLYLIFFVDGNFYGPKNNFTIDHGISAQKGNSNRKLVNNGRKHYDWLRCHQAEQFQPIRKVSCKVRGETAVPRPSPLTPPRIHNFSKIIFSIDSAIYLAKQSVRVYSFVLFFLRKQCAGIAPKLLQNNATQKDDPLRAHKARGK